MSDASARGKDVSAKPHDTKDRETEKAAGLVRCPACGAAVAPQVVKRMGGIGWVVLLLGLLFCLVGALFSLFFIEEHAVCPACGYRSR